MIRCMYCFERWSGVCTACCVLLGRLLQALQQLASDDTWQTHPWAPHCSLCMQRVAEVYPSIHLWYLSLYHGNIHFASFMIMKQLFDFLKWMRCHELDAYDHLAIVWLCAGHKVVSKLNVKQVRRATHTAQVSIGKVLAVIHSHDCLHFTTGCQTLPLRHNTNTCQVRSRGKLFSHLRSRPDSAAIWQSGSYFWTEMHHSFTAATSRWGWLFICPEAHNI